ncbi:hypothetical protein VTN49DRAFT_1152 [Thermomyces lanuginosus]|uniref:uncharacterized protein n=1 Tax=Thermomyces lanuginosus TaxID=5541 RepID=UPI0037428DF4
MGLWWRVFPALCLFFVAILAQPPLMLTLTTDDAREEPLSVRVLTHNIRYAATDRFEGEEPWEVRRQYVVNELNFHTRNPAESFICLQEVLHGQLVDVLAGLNDVSVPEDQRWSYIGVGRDDGKQAGEYSPIFYRPAVWSLLRWETVWLSETPDQPSKGWDAANIRILTVGVFQHRASGRTILALNTHFDHVGVTARRESARLVLQKIAEYRNGQNGTVTSGVFLAGDLNSPEDDGAYQELTDTGASLRDTHSLIDARKRYGNELTYTGFGSEAPPSRIDYIFLGPWTGDASTPLPWTVHNYAVLPNKFDDGVANSDHRAVVVDAALTGILTGKDS